MFYNNDTTTTPQADQGKVDPLHKSVILFSYFVGGQ